MTQARSLTKQTEAPVRLSKRAAWGADQPVGYLMRQAVEHPEVISLAAGLVDQQTLPVEEVRQAVDAILADPEVGRCALQYGTPLGWHRLREQVLDGWAVREGVNLRSRGLTPDHLMLTTGSQQFLELVSEVLLDPGDIVLVPASTYFVFLGTLANLGARAVGVAMDKGGLCLDSLESRLEELDDEGELGRVKAIYVTSYFQNPTGISLAEDRRPRLVEIARRWSRKQRIFVLEDAAYRDLRYRGPDLHSVLYYDEARDTVVFTQTFSKSCSPGLRVGYGVLPEALIEPVASLKGNHDFGSANFNQYVISSLITQGLYDMHVEYLVASYRRKLGVMLAAADEYFSGFAGVDWVRPNGGLYVWMTLPEGIDTGRTGRLFPRAVEEGVMYVPGEYCFPPLEEGVPRNHMRLSFGVKSEDGLREGMRRLSAAVGSVLG